MEKADESKKKKEGNEAGDQAAQPGDMVAKQDTPTQGETAERKAAIDTTRPIEYGAERKRDPSEEERIIRSLAEFPDMVALIKRIATSQIVAQGTQPARSGELTLGSIPSGQVGGSGGPATTLVTSLPDALPPKTHAPVTTLPTIEFVQMVDAVVGFKAVNSLDRQTYRPEYSNLGRVCVFRNVPEAGYPVPKYPDYYQYYLDQYKYVLKKIEEMKLVLVQPVRAVEPVRKEVRYGKIDDWYERLEPTNMNDQMHRELLIYSTQRNPDADDLATAVQNHGGVFVKRKIGLVHMTDEDFEAFQAMDRLMRENVRTGEDYKAFRDQLVPMIENPFVALTERPFGFRDYRHFYLSPKFLIEDVRVPDYFTPLIMNPSNSQFRTNFMNLLSRLAYSVKVGQIESSGKALEELSRQMQLNGQNVPVLYSYPGNITMETANEHRYAAFRVLANPRMTRFVIPIPTEIDFLNPVYLTTNALEFLTLMTVYPSWMFSASALMAMQAVVCQFFTITFKRPGGRERDPLPSSVLSSGLAINLSAGLQRDFPEVLQLMTTMDNDTAPVMIRGRGKFYPDYRDGVLYHSWGDFTRLGLPGSVMNPRIRLLSTVIRRLMNMPRTQMSGILSRAADHGALTGLAAAIHMNMEKLQNYMWYVTTVYKTFMLYPFCYPWTGPEDNDYARVPYRPASITAAMMLTTIRIDEDPVFQQPVGAFYQCLLLKYAVHMYLWVYRKVSTMRGFPAWMRRKPIAVGAAWDVTKGMFDKLGLGLIESVIGTAEMEDLTLPDVQEAPYQMEEMEAIVTNYLRNTRARNNVVDHWYYDTTGKRGIVGRFPNVIQHPHIAITASAKDLTENAIPVSLQEFNRWVAEGIVQEKLSESYNVAVYRFDFPIEIEFVEMKTPRMIQSPTIIPGPAGEANMTTLNKLQIPYYLTENLHMAKSTDPATENVFALIDWTPNVDSPWFVYAAPAEWMRKIAKEVSYFTDSFTSVPAEYKLTAYERRHVPPAFSL